MPVIVPNDSFELSPGFYPAVLHEATDDVFLSDSPIQPSEVGRVVLHPSLGNDWLQYGIQLSGDPYPVEQTRCRLYTPGHPGLVVAAGSLIFVNSRLYFEH
jgi:hypothetical protein